MALRQQVESRRGGKNVTPPGIWGSHHMTHDHIYDDGADGNSSDIGVLNSM